jgi:hypothetical protein
MARVNIYVPADLKARMDAVRRSRNWSEVVRPAILSAVASDEQCKGAEMKTLDLNAVAERLKASKERHLLEKAKIGRERGRSWASEKAEYDELRRVVDVAGGSDRDALAGLVAAIDPQGQLNNMDLAAVIGVEERDMSKEYATAFVVGAAEIFDQVAPQLDERPSRRG